MMAMSDERGEERPISGRAALLSALLGFVGVSLAGGSVWAAVMLIFGSNAGQRLNGGSATVLAVMLLMGGVALWGSARLKPWKRHDPMSPATRKTNALFGLSGLIAVAGCLALMFHTSIDGNPAAFFSNGPVGLAVALFAIVTWLLSWAIGWWWYFSADEHEQRASDVGLLVAGGVFATLTPAWWVAARAGLMPQPDAMVLWIAVNVIWMTGWVWRRNP